MWRPCAGAGTPSVAVDRGDLPPDVIVLVYCLGASRQSLLNLVRGTDVFGFLHCLGGVGLQGLADMAMAEGVPDDAGHRYADATFYAWIKVTGDGGLDQAALDRIQDVIDQYDTAAPIGQ